VKPKRLPVVIDDFLTQTGGIDNIALTAGTKNGLNI